LIISKSLRGSDWQVWQGGYSTFPFFWVNLGLLGPHNFPGIFLPGWG